MSATVSTRWFWSDWLSDPGLRACGYAARGLWKDLLCIAGNNKGREHGYVSLNGRKIESAQLARMTNGTTEEVESLLSELEHNGVCSVDRRGVAYCRRMVRAEKSRSNGRLGGNPNLMKNKENQKQVQPEPNPHIPKPNPSSSSTKTPAPAAPADDWPDDYVEQFWNVYPPFRRTAKKAVAAKLLTLRKNGEVTFAVLMAGLLRYVATNPGEYAKGPVVWINGGCWMDEHGGRSFGARPAGSSSGAGGFGRIASKIEQGRNHRGEPYTPPPALFPDDRH